MGKPKTVRLLVEPGNSVSDDGNPHPQRKPGGEDVNKGIFEEGDRQIVKN
jgi:hypothetical protein